MKKTVRLILINILMLVSLGVPVMAPAQQFDVISYGGLASSLSGELILLVEDAVKSPGGQLKILEIQNGLAYRNKSSYFIPKLATEHTASYELERLKVLPNKKNEKLPYVESARSILVMSSGTPQVMLDYLQQRRSTSTTFNSFTRYWDDLSFGNLRHLEKEDGQTDEYNTLKTEWSVDASWSMTYYTRYRLSFEGREFNVVMLPKSYGGLDRLLSAVKKDRNSQSLLLSTGNTVPSPEDDSSAQSTLLMMGQLGHQIVSVGVSELVGFKDYVEPYTQSPSKKDHPIQFISSNVCRKKGDQCESVFEPFTIVEAGGFKIAVVGVTSPGDKFIVEKVSHRYSWLKDYAVQDPLPILRDRILPLLHSKVDFIFLLTGMTPEEYGKILPNLNGVDAVFTRQDRVYNWQENNTYRFKNFKQRVQHWPMVELVAGDVYYAKSTFLVSESNLTIEYQKKSLDQTVPVKGELFDGYNKNLARMVTRKDVVLPDHRTLYPDKVIPSKEEFAKMAAEIMRHDLDAEVGIFNLKNQSSNMVGAQDASVVRTWVRDDEDLQIIYLSGTDIKKLIEANKNAEDPYKLAIIGIDEQGRIEKIAIRDTENYRVAIASTVTSSLAHYGVTSTPQQINSFRKSGLGYADDELNGKNILLSDFLVDQLRGRYQSSVTQDDPQSLMSSAENYRSLFEGRTPIEPEGYWVHDLKRLQLEYSQVSTTDVSAFSNVQDSRLQSVDQRYFSTGLGYSASYRKYPFVNELGLNASYTKLELVPANSSQITNILNDEIRLFANTTIPVYRIEKAKWLGREMGPFAELAYDTEFEKDAGQELKKDLLAFVGWKVLNGEFVKSTSLSLMIKKQLATGDERQALGANLRFELGSAVYNNQAQYRAYFDYRYFFDDDDTTNADLRSRLSFDQYFDLKFLDQLSFGPFFKYFSLTRKTVNETVNQTVLGVSLSYTNSWKPRFSQSRF